MSSVLIGQSYHLRFDPKLWREMQPYPPLGSLYAAALLRRSGFDIAFHDSMLAASEREWDHALAAARPRFAVLFEDNFNYLSKMCLLRMREASFRMIAAAKNRGCTTVVSGSDATDRCEEYLRRGADFVLIGEGEETLEELLSAHAGRIDIPPEDVAGIAFLAENRVVKTPRRPALRDLDGLPHPARDLVDLQRYRRIWLDRHGYYSANVATSRGCPFHCNWCAKPIWGQRYNARSPENVMEELLSIAVVARPDHLWFMDDIIGIQPGWMERFAELVEETGLRIPFKCLNRADLLLRSGEIDALRRAGCRTVWTGVESGSQRILDAMDKGLRVEAIYEAADRLHAAGIRVGFFIQFGYPGETREDIERTFDLVRRCRPDQIGVSVSYPLPGTPFYDRVRSDLGAKQNWMDSDDLAMLYVGPYSTAFYRRLHRVLHREFRARKAFYALREGIRSPGRLTMGHAREAAALAYNASTLLLDRWRMERTARREDLEKSRSASTSGLSYPGVRSPMAAADSKSVNIQP